MQAESNKSLEDTLAVEGEAFIRSWCVGHTGQALGPQH